MIETTKQSYFNKLIKGNISLAITYWLWFVFISILIKIYDDYNFYEISYQRSKEDEIFALSFFLLTLIYSIFIFIAVNKSANKYNGKKLWSFLAKVMVSINLFLSIFAALDIMKVYFFEDYAIENQISSYQERLPLKIDSFTQLYNISKEDKNILYTYKLSQLDTKKERNFNFKRFEKKVQDSLCEDNTSLDLLKKDYILKYTYIDKNDLEFAQITTNKEACGSSIYDLDILKEILARESRF